MNFNRKIINRIIIKFRNTFNRIHELEKRVETAIERTLSENFEQVEESYYKIIKSETALEKVRKETGLSFQQFRELYIGGKDAKVRLKNLAEQTEMNKAWLRRIFHKHLERRARS